MLETSEQVRTTERFVAVIRLQHVTEHHTVRSTKRQVTRARRIVDICFRLWFSHPFLFYIEEIRRVVVIFLPY